MVLLPITLGALLKSGSPGHIAANSPFDGIRARASAPHSAANATEARQVVENTAPHSCIRFMASSLVRVPTAAPGGAAAGNPPHSRPPAGNPWQASEAARVARP